VTSELQVIKFAFLSIENRRYGKARGNHARGKSEEGLGDFTFLYTD
jgi:hypothetical protein